MNKLYYNDKKLKDIKKKRTQKPKKIWGGILTGIGAMSLASAFTSIAAGASALALVSPLIFLIPGLYLLITAKRQVDRWDRYEAIIDNRGNTPISLIAKRMKLPEATVYSDLQEMIHSDFFIGPNYNIEAYLDAERDLLVMTSGGVPLKPLPDPPTEEERAQWQAQSGSWWDKRKKKAQTNADAKAGQYSSSNRSGASNGASNGASAGAEPGASGTAGAPSGASSAAADDIMNDEELREVELSDLERIQNAIASISDDEVRGYLYGLEGSVRRIGERLEDEPQLMEMMSIKRLYKYYLPQILELIERYQAPDTSPDLKAQIRDAMRTSANALSNIEADLLEREQMDAEVDIEVLKNMFAQDGLLDRSTAAAQGASAAKAQTAGAAQARTQAQPAGAAQTQQQAAGAAQAQSAGAAQVQQQTAGAAQAQAQAQSR